jgi:hypothetical protein
MNTVLPYRRIDIIQYDSTTGTVALPTPEQSPLLTLDCVFARGLACRSPTK